MISDVAYKGDLASELMLWNSGTGDALDHIIAWSQK
jgi:hypothetical protein